ncbi:hypothetical protein DFJ73DRAFT_962479 [Zopfochytrium polystomum]|nr:hypothetical protein DFJ73DRAFT_962479 [Zopfochytrium polystomum]
MAPNSLQQPPAAAANPALSSPDFWTPLLPPAASSLLRRFGKSPTRPTTTRLSKADPFPSTASQAPTLMHSATAPAGHSAFVPSAVDVMREALRSSASFATLTARLVFRGASSQVTENLSLAVAPLFLIFLATVLHVSRDVLAANSTLSAFLLDSFPAATVDALLTIPRSDVAFLAAWMYPVLALTLAAAVYLRHDLDVHHVSSPTKGNKPLLAQVFFSSVDSSTLKIAAVKLLTVAVLCGAATCTFRVNSRMKELVGAIESLSSHRGVWVYKGGVDIAVASTNPTLTTISNVSASGDFNWQSSAPLCPMKLVLAPDSVDISCNKGSKRTRPAGPRTFIDPRVWIDKALLERWVVARARSALERSDIRACKCPSKTSLQSCDIRRTRRGSTAGAVGERAAHNQRGFEVWDYRLECRTASPNTDQERANMGGLRTTKQTESAEGRIRALPVSRVVFSGALEQVALSPTPVAIGPQYSWVDIVLPVPAVANTRDGLWPVFEAMVSYSNGEQTAAEAVTVSASENAKRSVYRVAITLPELNPIGGRTLLIRPTQCVQRVWPHTLCDSTAAVAIPLQRRPEITLRYHSLDFKANNAVVLAHFRFVLEASEPISVVNTVADPTLGLLDVLRAEDLEIVVAACVDCSPVPNVTTGKVVPVRTNQFELTGRFAFTVVLPVQHLLNLSSITFDISVPPTANRSIVAAAHPHLPHKESRWSIEVNVPSAQLERLQPISAKAETSLPVTTVMTPSISPRVICRHACASLALHVESSKSLAKLDASLLSEGLVCSNGEPVVTKSSSSTLSVKAEETMGTGPSAAVRILEHTCGVGEAHHTIRRVLYVRIRDKPPSLRVVSSEVAVTNASVVTLRVKVEAGKTYSPRRRLGVRSPTEAKNREDTKKVPFALQEEFLAVVTRSGVTAKSQETVSKQEYNFTAVLSSGDWHPDSSLDAEGDVWESRVKVPFPIRQGDAVVLRPSSHLKSATCWETLPPYAECLAPVVTNVEPSPIVGVVSLEVLENTPASREDDSETDSNAAAFALQAVGSDDFIKTGDNIWIDVTSSQQASTDTCDLTSPTLLSGKVTEVNPTDSTTTAVVVVRGTNVGGATAAVRGESSDPVFVRVGTASGPGGPCKLLLVRRFGGSVAVGGQKSTPSPATTGLARWVERLVVRPFRGVQRICLGVVLVLLFAVALSAVDPFVAGAWIAGLVALWVVPA